MGYRFDRWVVAVLLFVLMFGLPLFAHAEGMSFKGTFSNHYRFRAAEGFTDNDIESILSLDFNQPTQDRFSGALQIGGIFDLDTNAANSPFLSAYDALNNHAVARIYYAYFDAKDLGPIEKVRVGRQTRYEFEALNYDGVTFESKPFHNLTLTAFGGVPVHLFENQIGFDPGDWVVGGALQWDPKPNFRARFDYVYLKDKITPFRMNGTDTQDNLFGVTLWWDIDPRLSLTSRFTSFSDQVRDVSFQAAYRLPDKDFSVRFDFYRLLQPIAFRVIDLDMYSFAGAYQPYTEFGISASKGFLKNFAVDGGVGIRFLDREQVASAFNHGFERAFLSFSMFDLPFKGFSLSITEDYYHGEDNVLRDSTFGTSGLLSQKLMKDRIKIYGGTAFYLYRFNLLAGNEQTKVQSYFGGVEAKLTKNLTAKVQYNFEHNSISNFNVADAWLIWSF